MKSMIQLTVYLVKIRFRETVLILHIVQVKDLKLTPVKYETTEDIGSEI